MGYGGTVRNGGIVSAKPCDAGTSRRTATPGGLTATQIQDLGFVASRATPGMDADGSSKITGDVNMEEYAKSLKANYGLDKRRTQSIDGAGRVINHRYDSAGRMLGVADAQGYRSQLTLDTEGHTQVAGLYLPGQEDPAKPYRAAYNWHDEAGRLTQRLLPDGRMDTYTYDDTGQLNEHQQNHGEGGDILHSYRSNAAQTAQAHIAQSADGWLRIDVRGTAGESATRQASTLIDDFGRVVQQVLPDHGSKTARYDESGRITQIHNADGSTLYFDYDGAARLVRRRYQAGAELPEQVLAQLSYQGLLLATITDPAQTTRYRHDALGRKTGEEIELAALNSLPGDPVHSPAKTLQTAARYDAATGLINARVLADGRVLRTRRSGAQTGATAQALSLQHAWVAWLQDQAEALLPDSFAQLLTKILPADTVVEDITVHPFDGLTGYQAGNHLKTSRQFDIAGRMTELKTDTLGILSYRYDTGPRIRQINEQRYRYQGFGRLATDPEQRPLIRTVAANPLNALSAAATAAQVPVAAEAAAARTATGATARYDALGRTTQDRRYRYSYTPGGQVETVTDKSSGKQIARYRYNSRNQRVSKTVDQTHTTHFLWQNDRLVAELDEQGKITSQYLYLAEGQRATPVAKLESAHNPDNSTKNERILYIHADHRATPMAMTDESQRIVWKAQFDPRGVMLAASTSSGKAGNQATLNLRLPGQYFDAETGLHDNLHRTYDPATGRYLQPDPLGYPDGPEAYLYAQGDPINKIDPLGLYEEDIHYYMTYFLARAAGVSARQAYVIATAAQYVDDNPLTRPTEEGYGASFLFVVFKNEEQRNRLNKYHFTQTPIDDWDSSIEDRFKAPYNDQVNRLRTAASTGRSLGTECSFSVLFGEYLHTFEDTFGHRTADNTPIGVNSGFGHLIYGHNPDYTYSDDPGYTGDDAVVKERIWAVRPARTLEMEKEVFERLSGLADGKSPAKSWDEVKAVAEEFNAIDENHDDGKNFKDKLAWLNKYLKDWGYTDFVNEKGETSTSPLDLTKAGQGAYNAATGASDRNCFLRYKEDGPGHKKGDYFKQEDFPGTILGTGGSCAG